MTYVSALIFCCDIQIITILRNIIVRHYVEFSLILSCVVYDYISYYNIIDS